MRNSIAIWILLFMVSQLAAQSTSEIGVVIHPGLKTNWEGKNGPVDGLGLSLGGGIVLEQRLSECVAVQIGSLYRDRGRNHVQFAHWKGSGQLEIVKYHYRRSDLAFPLGMKFYQEDYFFGFGGEASITLSEKYWRQNVSDHKLKSRDKLMWAWHIKVGMKKTLSPLLSLLLDMEFVDLFQGNFTNLNLGIGLMADLSETNR